MGKYGQMKERAEQEGTVQDITAEYHRWEQAGESIVGKLLSKNEVSSRLGGGTYMQYLFETDEGLVKCSLGRATDNELGAVLIPDRVFEIEYQGTEKLSGGRQINRFRVRLLFDPLQEPEGEEDVPF